MEESNMFISSDESGTGELPGNLEKLMQYALQSVEESADYFLYRRVRDALESVIFSPTAIAIGNAEGRHLYLDYYDKTELRKEIIKHYMKQVAESLYREYSE
jgi:hypothetical protein